MSIAIAIATCVWCGYLCAADDRSDEPGGVAGGGGNGTFHWTDAVNSFWNNAVRWSLVSGSGAAPPSIGDTARLDLNAYYEITIPGGQTTSTDALRSYAGQVLILSGANFQTATLHLTTGAASLSIEQGGEIRFGDLIEPVDIVVGSQTNLYNNSTLSVRYGSSFQTPILALGNQGFPSTGTNTMTVGSGGTPSILNVTNQAQIGRYGDLGQLTLQNDAQGTIGSTSFIGGASNAPSSDGVLEVKSGADLIAGSTMSIGAGHSTSSGTVRVEGAGSTITQTGAASLTVGGTAGQGAGDVVVDNNGVFTTGTGLIRVRPTGGISVGANNNTGQFIVKGTLEIDGGDLFIYPSDGLVLPTNATVEAHDGADVLFLDPYSIDGGRTFNVVEGCTFEMNTGGAIGDNGTDGTVVIDGSFFNSNGPLFVGQAGGFGSLTIDHSDAKIGSVIYLGNSSAPGSMGTMTIDRSIVESNITNVFGMAPNTTSTLTVTGFETELNINGAQLQVGHSEAEGASVIEILDQAVLSTTQGAGAGVAYVRSGGLMHIGNNAEWDADSEISVQGGELRVDGDLTVMSNAYLEMLYGVISGNGTIRLGNAQNVIVVPHGTISPGNSAGSLNFEGGLLDMDTDSVLEIELGGLTAGSQHDQLDMSNGVINLAGTLNVSLLPGYAPQPGDEFVIVTAEEAIFGTFDVVNTPTPMDVVYDYDANEVRLVALESCSADIVSSATLQPPPDGVVNGADLGFLLDAWGPNPGSLADLVDQTTLMPPPDGVVNGADLAVLLDGWGACE